MNNIMIPAWVNDVFMPVEKLEAHQKGFRHKAVSVFIVRGRTILLQRRALGKYHTPGLWANTCCTHPNWNEPAKDCAVRRLQQELGITGLDPVHRQELEYRADVGQGLTEHEVVDVFLIETAQPVPLAPNPAEVMDTRWVDFDTLLNEVAATPEIFTPWLKIYLRDHRKAIFGQDMFMVDPAVPEPRV
jgi:isopentenyl-diphosphate delta-isomerase